VQAVTVILLRERQEEQAPVVLPAAQVEIQVASALQALTPTAEVEEVPGTLGGQAAAMELLPEPVVEVATAWLPTMEATVAMEK
jgi:hypothetical protein